MFTNQGYRYDIQWFLEQTSPYMWAGLGIAASLSLSVLGAGWYVFWHFVTHFFYLVLFFIEIIAWFLSVKLKNFNQFPQVYTILYYQAIEIKIGVACVLYFFSA